MARSQEAIEFSEISSNGSYEFLSVLLRGGTAEKMYEISHSGQKLLGDAELRSLGVSIDPSWGHYETVLNLLEFKRRVDAERAAPAETKDSDLMSNDTEEIQEKDESPRVQKESPDNIDSACPHKPDGAALPTEGPEEMSNEEDGDEEEDDGAAVETENPKELIQPEVSCEDLLQFYIYARERARVCKAEGIPLAEDELYLKYCEECPLVRLLEIYHCTNVAREDDSTSVLVAELLDAVEPTKEIVLLACAARMFNSKEVAKNLKGRGVPAVKESRSSFLGAVLASALDAYDEAGHAYSPAYSKFLYNAEVYGNFGERMRTYTESLDAINDLYSRLDKLDFSSWKALVGSLKGRYIKDFRAMGISLDAVGALLRKSSAPIAEPEDWTTWSPAGPGPIDLAARYRIKGSCESWLQRLHKTITSRDPDLLIGASRRALKVHDIEFCCFEVERLLKIVYQETFSIRVYKRSASQIASAMRDYKENMGVSRKADAELREVAKQIEADLKASCRSNKAGESLIATRTPRKVATVAKESRGSPSKVRRVKKGKDSNAYNKVDLPEGWVRERRGTRTIYVGPQITCKTVAHLKSTLNRLKTA